MGRRPQPGLREKILCQALDLIESEGEQITMRTLASRLGLATGTVYFYFPSKAALLRELRSHGFEILHATLQPALGIPDPSLAIADLMQRYLRFAVSRSGIYRLMFEDALQAGEAEAAGDLDLVPRILDEIRDLCARGVEAGLFRPCNVAREASICWAMLQGAISLGTRPAFSTRDFSTLCDALISARVRSLQA